MTNELNPHSDLPFSLRQATAEEIAAQRASFGVNYTPGKRQAVVPRTVTVVTHVDSLGVVVRQDVIGDPSEVKAFIQRTYRDFSENPGEGVWVCCLDHVTVRELPIR